ncbi:MAG: hypothetical protein AB7S48_06070 [Bacteroidales bacterium]
MEKTNEAVASAAIKTQSDLSTNAIIDSLKEQANAILSSVLGSTPLQSFSIGQLGNIPYYWKNPSNFNFNSKTYKWISRNLKANANPLQQDEDFVNYYIDALSKVNFSLSQADTQKLNKAKDNATNQQLALLTVWEEAFGGFPEGKGQKIDNICTEIATKWADPPTTLTKIKNAVNPNAVLNNIPASGETVAPIFFNWLNAIGDSVSLQNNVTMNNAYLAKALAAAQSPDGDNGGLTLDNNLIAPSFQVATPVNDILNGLKNTSTQIQISMNVSRYSDNEYQVSVNGSTGFRIPIMDFFTLGIGAKTNYFSSNIAQSSNQTTIKMTFTGITLMNFGPDSFSESILKNWYWMKPITDAIKNADSDVSGFKFSPKPQIDFSKNGPFGFLMGVAISNYPNVEITVKSSNYQEMVTTFEQEASVKLSFLGIPLGKGSESTYSKSVKTDASSSTIVITLNPPADMVAGASVDSVGWVIGVQPNYPTSNS